jgi:hypothetical protein
MEPRMLLDADPLRVGGVYIEEDLGNDLHGDTFEITFEGGAADTELTRLVIDGDQDGPGFGLGDVFFDTAATGSGADNAFAFQVISPSSQGPTGSVQASVTDGSSQLVLDLNGFRAGDKLVFSIDVDEVEEFDPAETNQALLNEGFDPLTSGVEFQGSRMTAHFSAPHYHATSATGEFRNQYDWAALNLDLAPDNVDGKRDRTAGVGFEFSQEPVLARISGHVYHDRDNNGSLDVGEGGLANVEIQVIPVNTIEPQSAVTLTTDSSGFYEAANLIPGLYRVVEGNQPVGFFDGLDTAGTVSGVPVGSAVNPGDNLENIFLGGGDAGVNYNFGELAPASIHGTVHLSDLNGDCFGPAASHEPLPAVAMRLLDVHGNVIRETQTDAHGDYQFNNLLPGVYSVAEVTPLGLLDGAERIGSIDGVQVGTATINDRIQEIVLASGQVGQDYDFCEHEPVSISGFVYHDRHHDGEQSPGDEGLAGVVVRVVPVNTSLPQNPVSTTTNAAGFYEVNGLAPGVFQVVEEQPDGFVDGTDTAGFVAGVVRGVAANPGDTIAEIALTSGDAGVQYNFGEYQLASINGRVHASDSEDCFEPGVVHVGIGGVLIRLLDNTGQTVAETQTAADGTYRFGSLLPGTYSIVEQTPDGFLDGGERVGSVNGRTTGRLSGSDRIESITLASGDEGVGFDFCEHEPVSLAGNVFHDVDDDGSFEPGEAGIGGVEIVLHDDQGNEVASATTNSAGSYEFSGLRAGTFTLIERQPDGWRDGRDSVGTVSGMVVGSKDNDRFSGITLRGGEQGVEYNFGEFRLSSISGSVHADLNANCEIDPGEAMLEGVVIELLNQAGDVIETSQTDALGRYRFDVPGPGVYAVREVQPNNFFNGGQQIGSNNTAVRQIVSGVEANEALEQVSFVAQAQPQAPIVDSNTASGDLFANILVQSGQHLTDYNFCELPPAGLSGFVFQDGEVIRTKDGKPPADLAQIRDGQFTADDTPIAGVVLELREGRSGLPIDSSRALPGFYPDGAIRTITGDDGHYQFEGLLGGRQYAVYEVQPDGFFDGIDTPGTTTGLAFNVGQPIPLGTLQQLAEPPRSDAIVRIQLEVGGDSQLNNFSEVRVEADPDTPFLPPTPPPPAAGIPLAAIPPYIATPVAPGPISPPVLPLFASGGGSLGYTWHLSVINGGRPRDAVSAGSHSSVWWEARYLEYVSWQADRLREASWILAEGAEENRSDPRQQIFGIRGGIPVTGDFNGDGIDELAVYLQGEWFIDLNGNGLWDDEDLWAQLGSEEDLPVTGDWDGDGKDDIGIFGPEWRGDSKAIQSEPGLPDPDNAVTAEPKNVPPTEAEATDGRRLLQLQRHGPRRVDVVDHVFRFGAGHDIPVAGDWNGDGLRSIGVFRDGVWQLDLDSDGHWTERDALTQFGRPGDLPVVGDFDGNGVEEIGVYRAGQWLLDSNGDRELDARDRVFEMGGEGDLPVVGDWDGDGVDEPGLYREIEAQPGTPVGN